MVRVVGKGPALHPISAGKKAEWRMGSLIAGTLAFASSSMPARSGA